MIKNFSIRLAASHLDDHPAASEFRILLDESAAMAVREGLEESELIEMDAINRMRLAAEALSSEHYLFHSGTS